MSNSASNNFISYPEAENRSGISEKFLKNYFKVGLELPEYRFGNRKLLNTKEFELWCEQKEWRSVKINLDDYLKCLDFAIRSFYSYSSTSDFGTTTQRDAGKFVSNFTSGKLGEIAVRKFLKKRFDVDISLDFEIRDAIVGQDITEVAMPRRGPRVFNPPRIKIAIKTTKMKNVWLIVPENEVSDSVRQSDYYILARVGLHLNHFIRILREHSALNELKDIIPEFSPISAEVAGYAGINTLGSNPPVKMLPNPKQAIGLSYIINSGGLKKSVDDWINIISSI